MFFIHIYTHVYIYIYARTQQYIYMYMYIRILYVQCLRMHLTPLLIGSTHV